MKAISFCNQKGGVGKTTTAVSIAWGLANRGKKVLFVDMDPQGNGTGGLGINKNDLQMTIYDALIHEISPSEIIISSGFMGLDILPSNAGLAGAEIELIGRERREFILRSVVEKVAEVYDYVLIDCPPSLGLLTLNALVGSESMLIPLQCEYYALEGLGQLLETYRLVREKLNPDLELSGVILTMADFRTNLTEQVIEDVRSHFQDKVFRTVVPRSVKISEAPSYGKPIGVYDPHSRGAKCYEEITEEFLERFESPKGLKDEARRVVWS